MGKCDRGEGGGDGGGAVKGAKTRESRNLEGKKREVQTTFSLLLLHMSAENSAVGAVRVGGGRAAELPGW